MRPLPRNSHMPAETTLRSDSVDLLDTLPDAVAFSSSDFVITYANPAAAQLFGRPLGDLIGMGLDDAFLPGTAEHIRRRLRTTTDNGGSCQFEDFSKSMQKWLLYRLTVIGDGFAIWCREITRDKPVTGELDWTSPIARTMLDSVPTGTAPTGTVVLDYDGTILLSNRTWDEFWMDKFPSGSSSSGTLLSGKPGGTMCGPGSNYFTVCEQRATRLDSKGVTDVLAGLKQLSSGDTESFSYNYHWVHGATDMWFQIRATRLSGSDSMYVTHTDVTNLIGDGAAPRTDVLTGLANRGEIERLLNAELERCVHSGNSVHSDNSVHGTEVSLLLIDVDGFSEYNDALGHDHGDEVLRLVANRLAGSIDLGDTVGRWGGDEFVVIARSCSAHGARAKAARIREAIDSAFEVAGRQLTLTVGVGVATCNETHSNAVELIHDAAAAMHAAKAVGRSREHVFTPGLRESNTQRLDLIERLRGVATAERELEMMYQPIVDLASNTIMGAEALVRWHHPDMGLLMPDSFIPLAEAAGLIVPLSMWILDEVTRTTAAWQAQGLHLQVGVNISPLHLAAGTLTTDVVSMMDKLGIEPGNLVLEISESQTLYDLEQVADQLEKVRRHGALIAIDDFGTGFSSLERLATLPVDMIKIDKSLTQHLDSRQPHRRHAVNSLLRAVVDVSRDLDKDTVVEGIETEEQMRICKELGFTFGQGHLLGRPMSASALISLAAKNAGPRSATA